MILALLALAAPQATPDAVETIDAHSDHGAVYDIGPRQAARLMDNPDRVDFPVTLFPGKEHLQAFFHQGIGQLHGFWFLEAERTFRQILSEDPDCAMAFWGLAMASVDQPDRAAWFARAGWLKRGLVTKREQRYLDMLARFYSVDGPDEPKDLVEPRNPQPGEEADEDADEPARKPPTKANAERLVRDYEDLIWAFPDDVEAKALLANRIWLNRSKGIPTTSRMAVESILQDVLAVEPLHPVHHYRVHLWDSKETVEHIVESAHLVGPSWPNIAHNWHMGGHTFAKLGRHYDAGWQQEASARVDHAYMQRDWILPDQIHNFAHNNEWLTRSLGHQGRATEAIELAKNMIELPRHPLYNLPTKGRTSSVYGRTRLLGTLATFEQWAALREFGETMYLEPHKDDAEAVEREYFMGRAAAHLGDTAALEAALDELVRLEALLRDARAEAMDEAEAKAIASEAKRDDVRDAMHAALAKHQRDLSSLRDRIGSLRALTCVIAGEDVAEALDTLKKKGYDRTELARMMADEGVRAGDDKLVEEALKLAESAAKNREGQIVEYAALAYVQWLAGETESAQETFESVRELAALAELDLPTFTRLAPIAESLDLPEDWRPAFAAADDVAGRIDLETLGPKHWSPPAAPDFTLADATGTLHTLSDLRGEPTLVVFFLGFGCVHCVEQLQVIAPEFERFEAAGIRLLAVGTQSVEELADSLGRLPGDSGFPFPILSDPSLEQFRTWRAYDDFEDIALHGTYLVDAEGKLRWLDISHLPFMDVEFLLDESVRLLGLPGRGQAAATVSVSVPTAASPSLPSTAAEPAATFPVEPIPAGASRVALVLDTAPHCMNCVADIQRICSELEGFVVVSAVPNEARIEITFASPAVEPESVLSTFAAEGRPGKLDAASPTPSVAGETK